MKHKPPLPEEVKVMNKNLVANWPGGSNT